MNFFEQKRNFSLYKNCIMNDTLSDWFDIMNTKYQRYAQDTKSEYHKLLEKETNDYKTQFINHLCKKISKENIYNHTDKNQTLQVIKDKKSLLLNSELYNKQYNVYIYPDIIIHKDLFCVVFPDIKNINYEELPEYIIFDILYKIFDVNRNQRSILHSSDTYYYKCKIYCASMCIQKNYNYGFLIGKEYREKDNILPKKETIGIFTFDHYMKNTLDICNEWITKLLHNYDKWTILPEPSVRELYPNMNYKESLWNNEKKNLAELIHEITLVWNISYHKRNLLLDRNIKKWSDPLLLNNIYPFEIKDSHRRRIQDDLIHINKTDDVIIKPRKLKCKEFIDILRVPDKYMILDIESAQQLNERESYFTDLKQSYGLIICIIGTLIIHNNESSYKDFTIKYLCEKEERKIIIYWIQYIKNQFQTTNPIRVYHWGQAEKTYLSTLQKKYSDILFPPFECIDLLVYFKQEPITIKGIFGYGLKEIVNALYSHDLIQNTWTDDINGLDAMAEFMNISDEACYKNIPLKRYMKIKKIIYYNYMDCKVIEDILQLLFTML